MLSSLESEPVKMQTRRPPYRPQTAIQLPSRQSLAWTLRWGQVTHELTGASILLIPRSIAFAAGRRRVLELRSCRHLHLFSMVRCCRLLDQRDVPRPPSPNFL